MRHLTFVMLIIIITLGLSVPVASAGIRNIDFKNFSYPWSKPLTWYDHMDWQDSSRGQPVKLMNGRWRLEGTEDEPVFAGLTFESVEFADVNGDSKEDALVVLRFDTGGTQYYHYVYVYTLVGRKPKLLACFRSGDRSTSGLYRVYGEQGNLVVELFDPKKEEGDCCSSGFVRTHYRWQNGRFKAFGDQEFGTPTAPSRLPVSVFGMHN